MKKTYMIPETCVQKVELQQMIAASPNGNLNASQEITSETEIGAQEGSSGIWDDDED